MLLCDMGQSFSSPRFRVPISRLHVYRLTLWAVEKRSFYISLVTILKHDDSQSALMEMEAANLHQILLSDDLCVQSEESVFNCVANWMDNR